ncbi:TPA: hypothetical protein ACGBQ2_004960 [Yersinia enterocolitica]|nr:hypothetical protein [Yersinia enterocolitica]HDL7372535.1 hypothetical protein [Yersinia enterocolitica]HDL7373462.1 hypothetical protein [Yersinia enterocolitica]HDL7681066.1 hypothetical protein [Yersinia enterocolitica]HDL7697785.1 hypothetical protein [Yersinia enterocolitica]
MSGFTFIYPRSFSIRLPLSLNVSRARQRPMVMMDICTIGLLKERDNIINGNDKRKKERFLQLTRMAENGKYQFSFLTAIIEKGTDFRNRFSADELVKVFQDDYDLIKDTLGRENLFETPGALADIIPKLVDTRYSMEERAELSIPASLDLLSYFNTLRIVSTPSKNERFELAQKVASEGERLGLAKGYPTIAVCVASIYGCIDARDILKIRKDGKEKNGREFNPSNRLGDIMSFYRVAKARHMINSVLPLVQVIFRTEDAALENMHQYLHTHVTGISEENGTLVSTTCPTPDRLFSALYKQGKCIDELELKRLYELLSFKNDT